MTLHIGEIDGCAYCAERSALDDPETVPRHVVGPPAVPVRLGDAYGGHVASVRPGGRGLVWTRWHGLARCTGDANATPPRIDELQRSTSQVARTRAGPWLVDGTPGHPETFPRSRPPVPPARRVTTRRAAPAPPSRAPPRTWGTASVLLHEALRLASVRYVPNTSSRSFAVTAATSQAWS